MAGNHDEEVLIERARRGDTDAFCRLVELHQRAVHALALHFTGDPAEAEDLSQDVWLKAFRKIRSFRGQSTFYTWVRRIAINTLLDSRRHWWRKIEQLDEHPHFVYELPLENKILLRTVWRHLGALSAAERMTLVLRYVEGMSLQEIAETRSTSAGTVKKTLHRAIEKLRRHFDSRPSETRALSVLAEEG